MSGGQEASQVRHDGGHSSTPPVKAACLGPTSGTHVHKSGRRGRQRGGGGNPCTGTGLSPPSGHRDGLGQLTATVLRCMEDAGSSGKADHQHDVESVGNRHYRCSVQAFQSLVSEPPSSLRSAKGSVTGFSPLCLAVPRHSLPSPQPWAALAEFSSRNQEAVDCREKINEK